MLRTLLSSLQGDSVNVASKMESTGAPMRIQISQDTYVRLKQAGGFRMTERGETEIKGKGTIKTYFLNSKEDFAFKVPE